MSKWFRNGDPNNKLCTHCGVVKPRSEFFKSNTSEMSRCKLCFNAYMRDRSKTPKYREARKKAVAALRASSPRNSLYGSLSRALKRRPTEDAVTLEELLAIYREQEGKCALSGIQMTWGGFGNKLGKPSVRSMSIDRLDSRRGYTRDNVRLICHGINSMRGAATSDDELFEVMEHAVRHRAALLD